MPATYTYSTHRKFLVTIRGPPESPLQMLRLPPAHICLLGRNTSLLCLMQYVLYSLMLLCNNTWLVPFSVTPHPAISKKRLSKEKLSFGTHIGLISFVYLGQMKLLIRTGNWNVYIRSLLTGLVFQVAPERCRLRISCLHWNFDAKLPPSRRFPDAVERTSFVDGIFVDSPS